MELINRNPPSRLGGKKLVKQIIKIRHINEST